MLAVAALGLIGFLVALASANMLAAPPQIFDPQASKLLGRWLYLTYQTNIICCTYFAACLADGVLLESVNAQALLRLFPLIFALGSFLTISYYALDHGNPENYRRKERCRPMYPYVHWCSHLEHGHALPLVLLHCATVKLPDDVSSLPTSRDARNIVAAYVLFYILIVHINKAHTGAWPYAVIDDMTRMGGMVLRSAFFAGLAAAFILLGVGSIKLLQWRV